MTVPPEHDRIQRREVLTQLLRLAGATAFAGGLEVWLTKRSRRPEEALAPISKRNFGVPSTRTSRRWL